MRAALSGSVSTLKHSRSLSDPLRIRQVNSTPPSVSLRLKSESDSIIHPKAIPDAGEPQKAKVSKEPSHRHSYFTSTRGIMIPLPGRRFSRPGTGTVLLLRALDFQTFSSSRKSAAAEASSIVSLPVQCG
jgi:hypothetical protein